MERLKYPKTLVISHNVFSTTSNMGKTMSALFHGWNSESLAQLYFHSEIPSSKICKKYFRVTDFDMLYSIFKFKKPGKVLTENEVKINLTSNRIDVGLKSDIYQFGSKRKPFMYFFRNLLWKTNRWKTKELISWIEDFNPDIVFFAAGDYTFSIRIALQICIMKDIPLIVYFGDDYYFLNIKQRSLINLINRKIYKREFVKMFSYLNCFIAASDKMEKKYREGFNKNGYALMTSAPINKVENSPTEIKISYLGNLGLNRWKSLLEIGKCLKILGKVLDVYSGEMRPSIISNMNLENGIRYHKAVSKSKVNEIIKSSTIIIHVESMDKVNREKTKYSMSTKISESLGSGVCLFAYGPDDVSSIEYLVENNAACVVTTKETLQDKLKDILNSKALRQKYIKNALKLAQKRHNFDVNTKLFYNIVKDSCENKEGKIDESFTN